MSWDAEQREGIAQELRRNLELSGSSLLALADALDIEPERLVRTLDVADDADAVDVWMLRDHLERAVRAVGGTPSRYTVTSDHSRADAPRWFGLPIRRR